MDVGSFLLLSNAGHGRLRVRRYDAGLRVDNAEWTEDERLVLRCWNCRIPRERRCLKTLPFSKPILNEPASCKI